MGDAALCFIDQGKTVEAAAKLDQLGAITPQDWRVSLGRAVLASDAGDATGANDLFLAASLGAPSDDLRNAISARIKQETVASLPVAPEPGNDQAAKSEPVAPKPVEPEPTVPDNDLQLPLPK